jgi:hypothetical protein
MNKHLLGKTEDIQRFVRINISVLRESFLPYEADARQKFIIQYTGIDLHDELLDLYNDKVYPLWADSPVKEGILDKLLHHCQNALAMFTIYQAAPHMDLHLSEMGFVVTHSQNAAPASAQRVKAAVDAALSQGYDRLETMLRFLEKYHSHIPSYKDSEARVLETSNIINSATEFDQIVPISKSRLRFIALKPEMRNIKKLVLEPLIGSELFSQLVEEKNSLSLSPENLKLLKMLQPALAYMAVANTMDESNAHIHLSPMLSGNTAKALPPNTVLSAIDRFRDYGRNYLSGALKLLQLHPDNYPAYKNSKQYVDNQKNKPFENTDSPVFIFGQPSFTN